MAVTDDAFELVRDMSRLKELAAESGNIELQSLAVNISTRVGKLSRALTDLLKERDEAKDIIDPNKTYHKASRNLGSTGPGVIQSI